MQLQPPVPRREPIFNMPGIVTAAVVVLVAIHALRAALLSAGADLELLLEFAVVPARWTAAFDPSRLEAILREAGAGFSPQEAGLREALARYVVGDGAKPWTALTYAVLHGSWGACAPERGLACRLRDAGGAPLRRLALPPPRRRLRRRRGGGPCRHRPLERRADGRRLGGDLGLDGGGGALRLRPRVARRAPGRRSP